MGAGSWIRELQANCYHNRLRCESHELTHSRYNNTEPAADAGDEIGVLKLENRIIQSRPASDLFKREVRLRILGHQSLLLAQSDGIAAQNAV